METAIKTKWTIDKVHTEIAFKVKHMMISMVTGRFEDFEATIATENEYFVDADITFTAKTGSIHTKNRERDNHLKSSDFFNAAVYPEITFRSTAFDGNTLRGRLTIRGITKEVALRVTFNGVAVDPYGQTKAGFEITGSINRKDFDLTWNAVTEAGSIVVGDTVELLADVQFTKASHPG